MKAAHQIMRVVQMTVPKVIALKSLVRKRRSLVKALNLAMVQKIPATAPKNQRNLKSVTVTMTTARQLVLRRPRSLIPMNYRPRLVMKTFPNLNQPYHRVNLTTGAHGVAAVFLAQTTLKKIAVPGQFFYRCSHSLRF